MNEEKQFPQRKPTRLKCFDYNTASAYFITICTEQRRNVLSRIVGVDVLGDPDNVMLLPCGKIADRYIHQLHEFYDNISVEQYVIMPNHIHILLLVSDDGSPGTSTPTRQTATVSHFVSTLKRFCNKEYGENIWQRSFYDHVIRGRRDYEEIAEYIANNPRKWALDKLYSEGSEY